MSFDTEKYKKLVYLSNIADAAMTCEWEEVETIGAISDKILNSLKDSIDIKSSDNDLDWFCETVETYDLYRHESPEDRDNHLHFLLMCVLDFEVELGDDLEDMVEKIISDKFKIARLIRNLDLQEKSSVDLGLFDDYRFRRDMCKIKQSNIEVKESCTPDSIESNKEAPKPFFQMDID